MSRHTLPLAAITLFTAVLPASAQRYSAPLVYSQQVEGQQQVRYAAAPRAQMGGGFIEFVFNNTGAEPRPVRPSYQVPQYIDPRAGQPYEQSLASRGSMFGQPQGYQQYQAEPARPAVDPRYLPQSVAYDGKHAPGTIVIDTPQRSCTLVEDGGKAKRYGIGVGRPGFTWAGVKSVTRKAEWPDWVPPPEMLQRRPICRVTWLAVRTIRSARARCISAPRSIASMARTSPGPSAPRCPPAASACATKT